MEKSLILGLPNGSLEHPTLELLKKVGVIAHFSKRDFQTPIEGIELFNSAIIMRPQAIPDALNRKIIDAGICGWDCVMEYILACKQSGCSRPEFFTIQELNFSRKSRGPVKVVLFGRQNSPPISPIYDSVEIYSEYPAITRDKYPYKAIYFSPGSTEALVAKGAYDYGVCVTETGETIKDNNLEIYKTLLVSPTVLVAREGSPEIKSFGELLAGALIAEEYQSLTMNASLSIKDKVVEVLPALESPTISSLADGSFAIHTIVLKNQVVDTIVKLRTIGTTGIIIQDINVVLP